MLLSHLKEQAPEKVTKEEIPEIWCPATLSNAIVKIFRIVSFNKCF